MGGGRGNPLRLKYTLVCTSVRWQVNIRKKEKSDKKRETQSKIHQT